MKVLALDYGSARTGVAVSDPTGTLARPLGVVERAATDDGLRAARASSSASEEAERVVVGLPLTLRGEHGDAGARRRSGSSSALRAAARRARRDLRRALHDDARRAGRRGRRPRRRAPAVELPRVVEPPEPDAPDAGDAGLPAAAWWRWSCVAAVRRRRRRGSAVRGRCRTTARRRRRRRRRAAPPKVAADHLPRGLHARADGRARPTRSRSPRDQQPPAYLRGDARRRRSRGRVRRRRQEARSLEGFLFPATYDFVRRRPGRGARRASSSTRSGATGRKVNLGYARSKNLTPLRRADHRVDDREGGDRARASARSSRP